MLTRRQFNSSLVLTSAGMAATAKSYAQIIGANDRLNFAVVGLNSRAYAHLSSLDANKGASRISYVVDVDSIILDKFASDTNKELGYSPRKERDFRKALDSKDVDVVTIATPDHWHTPLAIAAMQAGKHVYVEKPCSHNIDECQLIVAAQRKTGKQVQMGTQQRSSPHTIEIVEKIHSGVIGRAYFAKAWYSNTRKTIGHGKPVSVPATLDWDLWQGPAPRQAYTDNIHPYNWHWFKTYGTGEALNNGTHEIDVCRWALGVDYPKRVSANGDRYHFKDDWQFYDTLVTNLDYGDKLISWEGMCSNGMQMYNRDRGSAIHGTEGTVIVDRAGYEIHDLKGKLINEYKMPAPAAASADLIGRDSMTDLHFKNFIDAIHGNGKLNAPIDNASISVASLLTSNIAWQVQREINLDNSGGFLKDPEATSLRTRSYEKGWEPKV